MRPRMVLAALAVWVAATEAAAQRVPWGAAPEFDGPAGTAALVLLISAGLLAYNRFRK